MKNMRNAVILLLGLIAFSAQAQEKERDPMAYMVVQSHQMCNSCVELIQNEMKFEKGVHKATVDTETFEIMVDYNPKKTDKEKVRNAIAKLGVDADDVKADPEGIKELPDCCKNNGCGKPKTQKEHKMAPQKKGAK